VREGKNSGASGLRETMVVDGERYAEEKR